MRAFVIVMLAACGGGGANGASVCGDGVVDETFEDCDDGNNVGGDGCSEICRNELCGNGIVENGEECDDDNDNDMDLCTSNCTFGNTGTLGFIDATWQFRNVVDGNPTGCPVGFDTAEFSSQEVGAGGPIGQPITTRFSCTNMAGVLALPRASYVVNLAITNSNQSAKYADALPVAIDLRQANRPYATTILNDGGYFVLNWQLRGETTTNVLSCSQGAAANIELTTNGPGPNSDRFNCPLGLAFSAGRIAGTYSVIVAALDGNNQVIGELKSLGNHAIMAPNRVTNLGTVTFLIPGL